MTGTLYSLLRMLPTLPSIHTHLFSTRCPSFALYLRRNQQPTVTDLVFNQRKEGKAFQPVYFPCTKVYPLGGDVEKLRPLRDFASTTWDRD